MSTVWPVEFPDSMKASFDRRWQEFLSVSGERLSEDARTLLCAVWVRSDFLQEVSVRHPETVADWLTADLLATPYRSGHFTATLRARLAGVGNEEDLFAALRHFRQYAMFGIVGRDLLQRASLEETTLAMSELACTCIDQSLDWLYADACRRLGTPHGKSPSGDLVPQRLVVLGMGKLGAGELNVSSDIDLIFAFPRNGETVGGERTLENQQFFIRLGQKLIQSLDNHTADGFVFRVDMRLRPYGQSGALVMSFAAMEEYYQDQGREWERYAMIKANVVAGDQTAGAELMEMLRPFVYRKYIDFSAFESLREMKDMISREVRRKGLEDNIKLGSGGIREIEFIAQAFQLIRGGRDPRLRHRELRTILVNLAEVGLLPTQAAVDLDAAYVFLRNLEHAVQGLADKQTQTLPRDELSRFRVALSMGFATWEAMIAVLTAHREAVSSHFADLIAGEREEAKSNDDIQVWADVWAGELDEAEALAALGHGGFVSSAQALDRLRKLREGRVVQVLQLQGKQRLDQFMPRLLLAVTEAKSPDRTLDRVLHLVERVVRRTAYLVLLQENPAAMRQLVTLCDASPWIAEQLAQTPLLLDELLNEQSLYRPPEKRELDSELRQQLLRIPEDDLEEQMECLRHFKKAHVLRVAASEIRGTLPLMKVSDYLTWIAEVILEQVLDICWRDLVAKHGRPQRVDGQPAELDFAIVGYGKLGGIELGYNSDLDLVFIHDADPVRETDGPRPIEGAVFYARLGQRIIHMLGTATAGGQLYEVDMRLRPSGNSGLLVSTLKTFADYQQSQAWTWEHQALSRARFISGDVRVGEAFETVRRQILGTPRDRATLRTDVSDMRQKMIDALGSKGAAGAEPSFQVKQDPGGLVDIEFMVQFGVLGWAAEHPSLTIWSDNVRQLDALGEAAVFPVELAQGLKATYLKLREALHQRALQHSEGQVAPELFVEERAFVREAWQKIMAS